MFLLISASNIAPITNTTSPYSFITLAKGTKAFASNRLTGIETMVPIMAPDAIFLILVSVRPFFFNVIACSTIGVDITPAGIPATETGTASISLHATIADIKNAKITTGSSPDNTRTRVTGAMVAVSSAPGAAPIMVYRTDAIQDAKIIWRIIIIFILILPVDFFKFSFWIYNNTTYHKSTHSTNQSKKKWFRRFIGCKEVSKKGSTNAD